MNIIESFKKHPMLAMVQIVAAITAFPAFYSTVSFLVTDTSETAMRKGYPLPKGWTAGVMNHGQYYKWWTISERPLLFALSITLLISALIILFSTAYFYRKEK
jgi:hypothetical protein